MLLDEPALRRASGRPSGRAPLNLPPLSRAEELASPKATLHTALREASELSGRRAAQFRSDEAAERLAELVQDWSPLRQLPAFCRLEEDVRRTLAALR